MSGPTVKSTLMEIGLSDREFMIIEGPDNMYDRVKQMILNAQREVLFIGNVFGMTRSQRYNVIETANTEAQRKKLTYRLIVEVTSNREDEQETLLNVLGPRFHTRHRELSAQFVPQFIIKDNEEALLFLGPSNEESYNTSGLWSNNPVIVNTLKVLYDGVSTRDQRVIQRATNVFLSVNEKRRMLATVGNTCITASILVGR